MKFPFQTYQALDSLMYGNLYYILIDQRHSSNTYFSVLGQ